MTVIRLAEQHSRPDGSFGVRIAFGEDGEYEVSVADPADPGTEEKLAWYFEEHFAVPVP